MQFLFIYIHIYYQFKTSNDREIYTLEEPKKDRLEEIANLEARLDQVSGDEQ